MSECDCGRPVRADGMCGGCYEKWRRSTREWRCPTQGCGARIRAIGTAAAHPCPKNRDKWVEMKLVEGANRSSAKAQVRGVA
jgi:hypothetical protein